MRGGLNLAALIAMFDGGQARRPIASIWRNSSRIAASTARSVGFDPRRRAERIHHVFEYAGFFQNDRLRVGRKLDILFAGRGEGFVGTVAVARIGRVNV